MPDAPSAGTYVLPPPKYSGDNEKAYRLAVDQALADRYSRKNDLILPIGKTLGFTAPTGDIVRFGFEEGHFAIQLGAADADLTAMASIDYVLDVQTGLEGSIATARTELTAAFTAADADVATTAAALVSTEATARANADSAEATTRSAAVAALQAADVTLAASVTAEATARANADSAEATTRSAAVAALQDADVIIAASVTTEAAARVSLDGRVSTYYGILLDAGDNSVSFELMAAGGGGVPGTGIAVLTAANFLVHGNVMVDGELRATKIYPGDLGSHGISGSGSFGVTANDGDLITFQCSASFVGDDTGTDGEYQMTITMTKGGVSYDSAVVGSFKYAGGVLVSPKYISGCANFSVVFSIIDSGEEYAVGAGGSQATCTRCQTIVHHSRAGPLGVFVN